METKLIAGIIAAVITVFVSILMLIYASKKFKLSKYQILIFIQLVLFWGSIIVVRSYRKTMANALGVSDEAYFKIFEIVKISNIAIMMGIYGLISVFTRLPFLMLSDKFKKRRIFIQFALSLIIFSSILVVVDPSYPNLFFSSLTLGIGASLLGFMNVMFSDTFTKDKAVLSVGILSIAPLVAEFICAPIQTLVNSLAETNVNNVKTYNMNILTSMWLCGAVIAAISLIFTFFVKDNKKESGAYTIANFKMAIKNKELMTFSIIAVFIAFFKFGTSGSYAVSFGQKDLKMNEILVAYLDVIFSFLQLISGFLMGIYLKKRIGVKNTLLLGLILSSAAVLISGYSRNHLLFFFLYGINGFGYGLTYNILIGMAMEPFKQYLRELTMGIFQTFFALGIFFGDYFAQIIIVKLNGTMNMFKVFGFAGMAVTILVLVLFRNSREEATNTTLELQNDNT